MQFEELKKYDQKPARFHVDSMSANVATVIDGMLEVDYGYTSIANQLGTISVKNERILSVTKERNGELKVVIDGLFMELSPGFVDDDSYAKYPPPKVVIEVLDGDADVTYAPPGIEVEIVNLDNPNDGEVSLTKCEYDRKGAKE